MASSALVRVRDSLPGAGISGLINTATSYFALRGEKVVPLSVDAISSTRDTAWSRGVILAFFLGVIISLLGARRFRKEAPKRDPSLAGALPPFFPFAVWAALRNGLFVFGAAVVAALIWQRIFGTVEVSPRVAAILLGSIAVIVVVVSEVRTKRAMLEKSKREPRPPRVSVPARV